MYILYINLCKMQSPPPPPPCHQRWLLNSKTNFYRVLYRNYIIYNAMLASVLIIIQSSND